MKRIYIYLTVMATLLIGGGKAMAQSVTIDGVVYSVDGDHAYVSGNSGVGDTVVVLGTVTINEVEYPVTEIGYRAFYRLTQVLSYTLPEGITSVGTEAFYDNYELKTINLPSSIESIGHMAFGYNWDVQITELPANLKTLDTEAFRGCQSATFTKIPKGITHIPNGAFRGCYSLTSLVLPNGLAQIDDYAFEGCSALKKILNKSSLPIEKGSTNYGYVAYYAQEIIHGDTCINDCWFITDEDGEHHLIYYQGTDSIITLPSDYQGSNYSINSNVFSGHDEIVSVQIPEAVTSIGASAFYNCTNMTSITIPGSVVSIGENAFYGCTLLPIENGIRYADCYVIEVTDKTLTEYTLKDNVRFLGNALFQDCSALTSVTIPSGVTEIGNNTFSGCSALTSLTLPESVTSIGGSAFYNCSLLTSVNIPSGVPSIEDNTFYGCSALTSLTLPETVTSIGSYAFYDCSSLTIDMPEKMSAIGDYAFYNCSSLTSLAFKEGPTTIGRYAFYNCTSLSSLEILSGVNEIRGYAFHNCQALESVKLPEGLTTIREAAFYICPALKTVNIPESVTIIEHSALKGCSSLDSITIPQNLTVINQHIFENCVSLSSITLPKKLNEIKYDAFWNCTSLKKIINYSDLQLTIGYSNHGYVAQYAQQVINVDTIIGDFWFDTDANGEHYLTYYEGTDSVLVLPSDYQGENYCIDGSVFDGHREIVSIQIPESVDSIGTYVFFNCSSLTSVNIPSGVPSIGEGTFAGCSSLTSLTLPETVTSIGAEAFLNCLSLTSVNIPSGVLTIGDNTFYGCSALTSLTLPESVTSIGVSAFYNCSSLTSVNIPSGVTSIGANTFAYCSSLTSLTLPESVTSIDVYTFSNCSSLTSVNIPSGVTKIMGYTFQGCSSLASLTIPASVTSISDYAFNGCTGLKELTFADGGETLSLGRNGYYESGGLFTPSKLEKLYLGRNLSYNTDWYYGHSPFYNIPTLKEVAVGDSVTSIGQYAFYNCSSLASISIPASVTSIGGSAFSGCGSLTYVHCGFESPQVLYGKDLREKAVIYVPKGTYVAYKEIFPNNIIVDGEANEVIVDITIPGTLGEEVLNQVAYLRDVNSLKVSGTLNNDDISTITGSMVNLIHLDLSKLNATSVNGIGHANLCSIVFPDSCKSISGYSDRDNLTSVTLPDAVKTLGDYCFRNCDQLKTVSFGNGDKYIGQYAFEDCDNLSMVSLGTGIATLGYRAFANCSYIRTFIIGEAINATAEYVFDWCGLSEIHIPNIEAWFNSTFSSSTWHQYLASIPNYASANVNLYIDGELLTDVVIPSSVTSIRHYAFYNIKGITSVTISEGVTSIGESAFAGCSGLTSVTIPEGVTSIGGSAFQDCSRLTSVSIPEGLKIINSNTFNNCDKLASIIVPEGVHTVSEGAFASCDSLRSITLPSTLNNCAAGAFSGSGLQEVTCPAFFPPVTGGDLIGANNCTLYVPEWTLNRYKLANNWNLFAAIEPISGIYPAGISVYTVESLVIPAEGLAEGYKPNLEIIRYDDSNVGRLTLRGEKAMPLSTFKMEQTRATGTMTSLVNYGTLTADSVVTQVNFSTNTWHYLTFPYDVKISDIATLGDWVIRRYDGASRARADFSSTWQNVPYDSILHAGEGYIWYSTNGNFTVPAIENDNRNLIFANDARYTQLKEHASATQANYGWNLIGNPYPCFYDTRFIEYGSPITVRSGNSYAAYSPVDDSYILSPLEAFFVQCSADNNIVAFEPEGRQTDNTPRALTSAPKRTRAVSSDRSVFNLYLENGSYADHTRFVINESASLAYEIACDAAKFMSDDPTVQQLFTIEGEERMAINERPFANGEVALGTYFGKSGNYTIDLDTRVTEMEVVLVDKYTGEETDLMTDSYTFTTEAGTFTDRFAIRMKRTGVVDAIEAAAAAKVQVTALSGVINIMNAAAPVSIYNAAGALVTTMDGGDVTVEVAPGMYIVKVGDEIHKVSVIK